MKISFLHSYNLKLKHTNTNQNNQLKLEKVICHILKNQSKRKTKIEDIKSLSIKCKMTMTCPRMSNLITIQSIFNQKTHRKEVKAFWLVILNRERRE